MTKACESKFTDQSIFNNVFGNHVLIPGSFNDERRFRLNGSHIIHFVGEPKPWQVVQKSRRLEPARFNASRLWRHRCARLVAAAHNESAKHRNRTTVWNMVWKSSGSSRLAEHAAHGSDGTTESELRF
jgi:lipopolysaccharide biosynthesis glycosyltransferase